MKKLFGTYCFTSIIYFGTLIYIATAIFEGPLRFLLHTIGIDYLLYLRDIFIFIAVFYYCALALQEFKINKIFLVTIFIMIFHSIIALFYLNNYLMILFAWKIYLPICFGILYGNLLFDNIKTTKRVFIFFLLSAILGVTLNFFKPFPWEGLEYSVAGVDIEGVRAWTMYGIKRLSGFSRASFDAAIQILLLVIFIICYIKNKYCKILLWLLAGPAILLTTTKGILSVYILITLFFIVYRYMPNYFKIYQKLLLILCVIGIILPPISYYIPRAYDLPLMISSFFERIFIGWPDAFQLVRDHGNLLLGRGFGGMGTSQFYFEPQKFNPGDSIYLLAYGNFGLLSIVYFLYIAVIGQSINLKTELFYYLFLLSFFAYGITTSCIENSLFSLFLGTYLGYMHNQNLRTRNKKFALA
jgi:hypothetical protein